MLKGRLWRLLNYEEDNCIIGGNIKYIIKAQNISGSLIDESGNPISFANVVLLNRCDSSFVQGTISDENGNFSIGPFTDESYT